MPARRHRRKCRSVSTPRVLALARESFAERIGHHRAVRSTRCHDRAGRSSRWRSAGLYRASTSNDDLPAEYAMADNGYPKQSRRMNKSLRWKLILAFVLVFLAGAACGFFGAVHVHLAFFARHGSRFHGATYEGTFARGTEDSRPSRCRKSHP